MLLYSLLFFCKKLKNIYFFKNGTPTSISDFTGSTGYGQFRFDDIGANQNISWLKTGVLRVNWS